MTGQGSIRLIRLLFAGVLAIAAGFAAAQEPVPVKPGLMWNRTGLPAVFPLRVKTAPGANYYLELSDDETGTPALAAYIEGGTFFRVLVPPGRFNLRFATGDVWRGEAHLFGEGSQTQLIDLSHPLEFGVKGIGTKSGHSVDLTALVEMEEASRLGADAICQTVDLVHVPVVAGDNATGLPVPLNRAWQPKARPLIPKPEEETVTELLARSQRVRTSVELERDRARDAARRPADHLILVPRYEVRVRPCE